MERDATALWRVDLHTHTWYSRDSLTGPRALVDHARQTGLARLAVTDHNTITGALEAHAYAPEYVIVGEEIEVEDGGELIAYFVAEEIPAGLPVEEAVRRLRAQGSVISISHPCDRLRNSAMGEERTRSLLPLVDAIEVFNSRCLSARFNVRAQALAASMGVLGTAGSDGHTLAEIGKGYVLLPPFADDPDSFRAALEKASAAGRLTGGWPHLMSSYAKWRKRRGWRRPAG